MLKEGLLSTEIVEKYFATARPTDQFLWLESLGTDPPGLPHKVRLCFGTFCDGADSLRTWKVRHGLGEQPIRRQCRQEQPAASGLAHGIALKRAETALGLER